MTLAVTYWHGIQRDELQRELQEAQRSLQQLPVRLVWDWDPLAVASPFQVAFSGGVGRMLGALDGRSQVPDVVVILDGLYSSRQARQAADLARRGAYVLAVSATSTTRPYTAEARALGVDAFSVDLRHNQLPARAANALAQAVRTWRASTAQGRIL